MLRDVSWTFVVNVWLRRQSLGDSRTWYRHRKTAFRQYFRHNKYYLIVHVGAWALRGGDLNTQSLLCCSLWSIARLLQFSYFVNMHSTAPQSMCLANTNNIWPKDNLSSLPILRHTICGSQILSPFSLFNTHQSFTHNMFSHSGQLMWATDTLTLHRLIHHNLCPTPTHYFNLPNFWHTSALSFNCDEHIMKFTNSLLLNFAQQTTIWDLQTYCPFKLSSRCGAPS